MKTDKLLFGAAYYDEYLPTDRIETDMEMMKKAGMNVIRIAESTWSTWEPQENIFDFTHLHRMLTCSKKHGIQVIVGTPTYAVPTWLVRKYPDIITETHNGPGRYGRRQNMDICHPMYLMHAERIIRRLMEEVQPYDHVIGFQLDNETKSYDTCSVYAQKKFVTYVRELFQDDLERLNEAWGLDYWSNRINTWEDFPDVRGAIARSLKKDNYLVLETEAQGNHGWLSYPGQLRLQAFSHLANGANCVEYWHWHSIHNAIESYWKGVLSHNLKENATYREACRIGADFAKYGTHLVNLKKHCPVAILLDNESLTALQWFPTGGGLGYNEIFRQFYDALYEMNIECDILSAEDDIDLLGHYKLLITPALYSVSDTMVDALKRYVAAGGVLLATFRTAVADRMLKIWHDDLPHGLTDVFGMTYDQFTNAVEVGLRAVDMTESVNQHSVSESTQQRHHDCVRHWMELLLPDTAETLALYDHPHWGDCAAVTGNRYGQGYAAYLGCYTDMDIVKKLLGFLCEKAGIAGEEAAAYPLIVKRGTNDLQKEITYYFNYSEEAQETVYHGADARVLLSGQESLDGRDETPRSGSTAPEATSTIIVKDGDHLSLSRWDFLILEEL